MRNSLFVDVHILQTVPPSNINRDDTGSPKSARFGGMKRARVSSQAWKKATRDLFPDMLGEDEHPSIIATGSNAPVIVRYCRNKVLYDKYLLMEGLWDIYQKNHG